MALLLAMSAYQSRTQDDAFSALAPHFYQGRVAGLQLTPGNLPSPGFRERICDFVHEGAIVRVHEGFSYTHYRRRPLSDRLVPVAIRRDQSIHAPRKAPRSRRDAGPFADWESWRSTVLAHDLLVETMYPGHALGCGEELDDAMDHQVRLAIDIAHLSIQRDAGVLTARTLDRVLQYEHVEEVHVSHSQMGKDTHSPLVATTPFLGWARERISELPVVLESYWHKQSLDQQLEQLALLT